MPTITTVSGTVKQFSYRTARVDNSFLRVSRDTVKELEEQLATAAGVRPDNHTVYEIVQDEEMPPVYIMFSDFTATFGLSVVERRW